MTDLSRLEVAENHIDLELAHLWEDLARIPEEGDRTLALRIARAAWAAGYMRATTEKVRGAWLTEHGYRAEAA